MTVTAGRVLRGKDVKLDGSYQLDVVQTPVSGKKTSGRAAGQVPPKVRIAQKAGDFAIIEVACGCGEIIQIKCNYAGAKPSPQPAQQENIQEAQNAIS